MNVLTIDIEQYFFSSTGYLPYAYQIDVFKTLLAGKNVILNIPTGAGKTWASILPFFFAKEKQIDFPQKMIYSLPLRTLVNSIHIDVIENEYIKSKFPNITKQTGEFSDDPLFESEVIFSTIDQTLSSFLSFPLSLSPSQANINAGALIGSYLVFDEFNLLHADLAMATTIGSLKKLGTLCRCCIMTATLSKEFKKALADYLPNYEIITLGDYPSDKEKIKSLLPIQDKKIIDVVKHEEAIRPLTADYVVKHHKQKTIVICNQVERAQQIFYDLRQEKKTNENFYNTELVCLHSRFFDEDRKKKEKELKKLFGKNSEANAILIATQVIEAGMDISCDVLHTEISPVDSFLQRAGRCARFENEKGEVFIYGILEEKFEEEVIAEEERKKLKSKYRQYLPYSADLCEKTLNELQKYQTLDGEIPKRLIETILSEYDKQIINRLYGSEGGGFNQKKIIDAWSECNKNNYRNTIRDIQSVELVLMTDEDENHFLQFPYSYQSITMFRYSFQKWFKQLQKQIDWGGWVAKELSENNIIDFDMADKKELRFMSVTNPDAIPAQIFINAEYFKYDPDLGLNLIHGESKSSPRKINNSKSSSEEHALTKDSFVAHSVGLWNCYIQEFKPKLHYAFKVLNGFLGLSLKAEDYDELFKLTFAFHDIGKLNKSWQKPMRQYQAYKENKPFNEFSEILAHSDFDRSQNDNLDMAKKFGLSKRPPHASVGSWLIQPLLNNKYDNEYIASAISFAIARHHSAGNMQIKCSSYEIPEKYYNAFEELLDELGIQVPKPLLKSEKEKAIEFENEDSVWLLYFFFVRVLRLCDQKATANLKEYLPTTSQKEQSV